MAYSSPTGAEDRPPAVTVGDDSWQFGPSAPIPTSAERIRSAMPIVGYVVTDLIARLPAHVRRDELESAGYEALVRCAASYDPSIGTSFSQYARRRVHGAVLDELRSSDWASRGTRRAERRLAGAEERLTQTLGRHPSSHELAAELGEEGTELTRTRDRVQRAAVLSLNALVGDNDVDLATNLPSGEIGHAERIIADERTRMMHAAVEALPERLRVVVQAYFLGETPMAEIAQQLGVSESRISQMRAQALELLKEGMTRALDEAPAGGASAPGGAAAQEAGVAARRREEYYARVAAMAGTSRRHEAAGREHPAASTFTLSALA